MPITFNLLTAAIEQIAPLDLQLDFDHSGIQIDTGKTEIKNVLIALEITSEVIAEAKNIEADVILTHHPLFFSPLENITPDTLSGKYALELIPAGISVYSAHTSFDVAPGGINDGLADLLGLSDVCAFPESGPDKLIARVGNLPDALEAEDVSDFIFSRLSMSLLPKIAGDKTRQVKRIAVCGGAGGDLLEDAVKTGADLYVTSDVKHHQAQAATEYGILLADAGHFDTEKHFASLMAAALRTILTDEVAITVSKTNLDPYR